MRQRTSARSRLFFAEITNQLMQGGGEEGCIQTHKSSDQHRPSHEQWQSNIVTTGGLARAKDVSIPHRHEPTGSQESQTKRRICSDAETQAETAPLATTTTTLHVWKDHGCIWRPRNVLHQRPKNHNAQLHQARNCLWKMLKNCMTVKLISSKGRRVEVSAYLDV